MKKLLLLLLPLLLLTSCGMFRSAADAYRPDEPLSVTAKLSAKWESDDRTTGVGGTLRMRRDHVVQLSFSKFGIEGARLVFTPDSVVVLDRLHKLYLVAAYDSLRLLPSDAPPLRFADVQAFFWNDHDRSRETIATTLAQILPLELNVERSRTQRIQGYKIPQQLRVALQVFDRDARLELRLSNLKINYNWNARTAIPEGYTPASTRFLDTLLRQAIR